MAATGNIIIDINTGIKLNRDNYRIWCMRVRMVLVEMNALDHTTMIVVRPTGELNDEQRTYHNQWEAKDTEVRAVLLSMMEDHFLYEFEQYTTSKELWDALRLRFGVYTTAQLRLLNIVFYSYRLNPQHNLRQHLRHMVNMIAELREAGQVLTEEQKIQAVIRSLPDSLEHMKMQLVNSDHLNTFEQVRKHIELEDDMLSSSKNETKAHLATSGLGREMGRDRKRNRSAGRSDPTTPPITETDEQKLQSEKEETLRKRKAFRRKETQRCHNCGTKGHLVATCLKPLKAKFKKQKEQFGRGRHSTIRIAT